AGRPVTIRLLDPPLHEFLPRESRLLEEQGDLREKRTGLEHVDQALRTEYALDSGFQRILPRAALETELARVRTRMDELKGDLDSVRSLQEANPMLGNRGCRMGITYPEIYEMQVRAIFEAAAALVSQGVPVEPEVMIPLTGTLGEMRVTREMTHRTAEAVLTEAGGRGPHTLGPTILVPPGGPLPHQRRPEAACV